MPQLTLREQRRRDLQRLSHMALVERVIRLKETITHRNHQLRIWEKCFRRIIVLTGRVAGMNGTVEQHTKKKNRVVIWIKSGCAEVQRIPEGIEVIIVDKDCGETECYQATQAAPEKE